MLARLERCGASLGDYLLPSRGNYSGHMSTRQHARLADEWVSAIRLYRAKYGTCWAAPRSRTPSEV